MARCGRIRWRGARGWLVLVASVCPAVAPRPAGAQATAARSRDWHLSFSVGLVGREIATWKDVHLALSPTGWDSRFPGVCTYACANASDNVEGRPLAPAVAVRRRLRGAWQLRLMAARASAGYYPGAYVDTPLTVRPVVTTVGAQAVRTIRSVWFAAGPSFYRGSLATAAGPSRDRRRGQGIGLVLTAGAAFPRTSSWFVDVTIERRFARALTSPVIQVPGAPDVPALRTGLSGTVLSAGVGLRL